MKIGSFNSIKRYIVCTSSTIGLKTDNIESRARTCERAVTYSNVVRIVIFPGIVRSPCRLGTRHNDESICTGAEIRLSTLEMDTADHQRFCAG